MEWVQSGSSQHPLFAFAFISSLSPYAQALPLLAVLMVFMLP